MLQAWPDLHRHSFLLVAAQLDFNAFFGCFSSFFILFHPLSTSMLMVPRFIETKSDDWLLWEVAEPNQQNFSFAY